MKLVFGRGQSGSRYFCESFYGHPCPTSGKNYATANAFGGPSRPASLVAYPTRGMQHRYRNDSTRFRKACIFTTQKALRENTCPIASGDYSTPVSQREKWSSTLKERMNNYCFNYPRFGFIYFFMVESHLPRRKLI
jgi:hypothetical protein